MIAVLDMGSYLSEATAWPDWEDSGTVLIPHPAMREQVPALLGALSRTDLPPAHLLVATSGSTAPREGGVRLVALSLEAFLASAVAVNAHLAAAPGDIWAHALPVFHVGGLGILARARLSGSRVVAAVDQKWSAHRYHERVASSGATLSALVPSQIHDLASAGLRAPSSLRAVVVGGARLDPSLYGAACALGWPCLPSYGLTETCSQVATARPGSAGEAYPNALPILPHADLSLGPDGRIRVCASSLLTCYVSVDPASGTAHVDDPKRGGWFETEDLGRLHAGGIEILGRADDMVKVLGELVSLAAVEGAVGCWLDDAGHRRSLIADYAVVSLPHPRLGSELVLAVVPAPGPGAGGLRARDLAAGLKGRLGPLECPSRLIVVDVIPRTALGKVRRARLADHCRYCRGSAII
ncbi:MAG: AMP-binding protein [Acidobacteriota bacterium]